MLAGTKRDVITSWLAMTKLKCLSVKDISCTCEQQQGNIPSMFAACNVDYIVDISSSDRIARERFRFLEHRF